MKKFLLEQASISDTLLTKLVERDAVLWLPDRQEMSGETIRAYVELASLPWRFILCESSDSRLIQALESVAASIDRFTNLRGFIHLVAVSPQEVQLPPRSLPILLLKGRPDRSGVESVTIGRNAALRRRLNMVNHLVESPPSLLLFAATDDPEPLLTIRELWEQESFRCSIATITTSSTTVTELQEWLTKPSAPNAIDYYPRSIDDFARELRSALARFAPEEGMVVKVRASVEEFAEVDLSSCDLPEQPIFDRYDLIKSGDQTLRQPQDLSHDDLVSFFDKTSTSWRPYAAGLPWPRFANAERALERSLKRVHERGAEENCVLVIASESGAGGTTAMRALSLSAARLGYPVLVARPISFKPSATEIESFLYRAQQVIGPIVGNDPELPFLLSFDAAHWTGREGEIRGFVSELSARKRSAVVLLVRGETGGDELTNTRNVREVCALRHEIEQEDAITLGIHINRYLAPHGKTKSPDEWLRFWEAHRPKIDAPMSSFWIALEFWLKGQLDLSTSIQQWMYAQYKALHLTTQVRLVLMEVAALTIDRRPLPEMLFPAQERGELPASVELDKVKGRAPALGIVKESQSGRQRHWAMSHALLARYFLNSIYFDRAELELLGLADARDPVELRIILLGRVARRPELARPDLRDVADDLAVRILKLDVDAAAEFFQYWREVLKILKDVPVGVRDVSRTFNHHVAISCRRIATNTNHFESTLAEKREVLQFAIDRLRYSLEELPKRPDDESDLSLWNSLSLAYQNLADLENLAGADQNLVLSLRQKATDATRRAQQEDPSNSYVLETTARNLIQNAEIVRERAVEDGTEALCYIYEAAQRDNSEGRRGQLSRLAKRALKLLRSEFAVQEIAKIGSQESPHILLARAWLLLADQTDPEDIFSVGAVSGDAAEAALEVLEPLKGSGNWLAAKFRYDLTTVARPFAFEEQVRLLDELIALGVRLPHQSLLEYAILLHQRGRHHEANEAYTKLRQALRGYDVVVFVPSRLRWLLTADGSQKRVCDARVVETQATRSFARVTAIQSQRVPFIPQDFGQKRMAEGQTFKCTINFGQMGPFIKPPQS
jgi:hypothetical protein